MIKKIHSKICHSFGKSNYKCLLTILLKPSVLFYIDIPEKKFVLMGIRLKNKFVLTSH